MKKYITNLIQALKMMKHNHRYQNDTDTSGTFFIESPRTLEAGY